MAENFITYRNKPLVRSGNEIYYGNMTETYVIKLTVLSEDGDGQPNKIKIQLLKSDTVLSDKDRVVKETTKDTMFDALDFGFVWLERALKA